MVESPCIDVCTMDETTGLCQGCWRSIEEISAWATASDETKRQILAAIAERRCRSGHGPRPSAADDVVAGKARSYRR